MSQYVNRREFLKGSALAATGVFVARGSALAQTRSPNEKLNIGIIGVHSRGAANMASVATENIVALCDVNETFLAEAATKYPKAKTYLDWRKMVDQKDIDAVVVSTTEHTHALASVWAMKRGKHVFCEKPLAHSVYEARVMRDTAKQAKVATQMGTQIHASENYRRVVELIQSGAIGPVREAHAWVEQGIVGPRSRPAETEPVPKDLNWDLWLGPAPERPYHSCYFEKRSMSWQNWWDFGNGALGDMGSHIIDLPFWALDLKYPATVEAEGPLPVRAETYPDCLTVRWEHPARGKYPPVKLTWYDGKQWPKSPEGVDLTKWHLGVMFMGDKGILVANYSKWILLPEAKFKDFKPPEPSIPKSLGHHQEWINACKTGTPTLCNFDYSGALVEHNLLGTVAFRAGKKLEWDAENLKARNCPEADQFIRQSYRKGWTL
ncbi:MAG: Gfo/Idh/MocA family oxidoreductase [Kiritimatiellae bacterium]|nr:Gfo/Idh/MocA family oxidoreductase [Kiritimatiellia bacterium]MDD5522289.1 Gfo/Idh/MocA family oxidoreductase [Kiritimatiellia bacterium]